MADYSIEGLHHGMERCEHNIKVMEEAIEKERSTIASYKIMIADIQQAKKDHEEAAKLSRTINVGRD